MRGQGRPGDRREGGGPEVPGPAGQDPSAPQRWVFRLTVAFLFAAAVLRSVIGFKDRQQTLVLVLLGVWLLLVVTEEPLSRRRPTYFALYATLTTALILFLLGR